MVKIDLLGCTRFENCLSSAIANIGQLRDMEIDPPIINSFKLFCVVCIAKRCIHNDLIIGSSNTQKPKFPYMLFVNFLQVYVLLYLPIMVTNLCLLGLFFLIQILPKHGLRRSLTFESLKAHIMFNIQTP